MSVRFVDVEQNSPEWFSARSGIITASSFECLITPTGKQASGKKIDDLANKIIAELVTKDSEDKDSYKGYWTERGHELEPDAAFVYGVIHEVEPIVCGFAVNDRLKAGCSPDRLIGDVGMVQIKCPAAKEHIKYLLADTCPDDHKPQVQGELLVCEREWNDLMSYHPHQDIPPAILRCYRDEPYLIVLSRAIKEFNEIVEEKLETLKEKGIYYV